MADDYRWRGRLLGELDREELEKAVRVTCRQIANVTGKTMTIHDLNDLDRPALEALLIKEGEEFRRLMEPHLVMERAKQAVDRLRHRRICS